MEQEEGEAKALAHIIFLFDAVIKQSACHCSKVNRLTFKYSGVSGAPPAPSETQLKTDQHLLIRSIQPLSLSPLSLSPLSSYNSQVLHDVESPLSSTKKYV